MTTHLATCPSCRSEMDVTDVGPFTRVHCPGCGEEVRVKTELGGFRLIRRLAVGGMSVVYVARDLTLDREVAMKILSEEYSADEKRERQFEREADLTASVSHPNVVRVFTVGRAFERFYIAMELVSGESLEQRMAVHGALPEDQVIHLAIQVVDGLRAAKAAGLIHRDIKPGNILIDQGGTAKIVDFGLSLLTEGGAVRAEEIWATPCYVPPEALEHDEEDFRSDIYALGASLYHALAGKAPVDPKEMSTRVLREEKRNIPPLKKVAPWLSAEITGTVERAMAHERSERFSSYEELRRSLEAARAAVAAKGTRIPVHGTVRAKRRSRQEAHRKAWLAAFGVVVLIVLTVTAYVLTEVGGGRVEPPAPADPPIIVVPGPGEGGLDPAVALEISSAYEGAREALAEDDFMVAEEQFLEVRDHPEAPVPTAAWAGFEAAVVAFLDGRPGDARERLSELEGYLEEQRAEESAVGRRLRSAAAVLTSVRFIPEDRIPKRLEDPFRATAFFAMGLKTWEQGQLGRAAAMFKRLAKAGPWPDAEWVNPYRSLAGRYVEDYHRMTLVDHRIKGKRRAELQKTIEDLEVVYASLETRGRARFNVKVWQVDLTRRLRQLEARRVAPRWREIRGEVAGLFREARFAEASEKLKGAAATGELEEEQRAVLIHLSDAASAFLQELRRALGPGAQGVEVAITDGTRYKRILGTQDGGLLVEAGGAAKLLGWSEIRPQSLLELHRKLVDSTESSFDRQRRLMQATAFSWLHGMKTEAEGTAGELAALKPAFGPVWSGFKESLLED